jgi:proline iminopeptidase
MRRKLLIVFVAVLLLVGVFGFLFWRSMGEPMYTPGMVRSGENLRGPLDPPKQSAEISYWLVEDDIRLFYNTQGHGRPVLLVHGGPGYPIHGPLPGLELLTKDHKLYYYDQRGCGKSTKPFTRFGSSFYANMKELERTLGIGAQVADIERIRRILGQEKLILMGHSFGGFLATLYGAEFPEYVESLVLVAPAGVLVLPDNRDGEAGFFEQIRARLPADQQAEYDRFVKEYLDFGSVFSKSEDELAAMNRRVGTYFLTAMGRRGEAKPEPPSDNGGWMVQALYFSMGKRHDYREALRKVQAPVLIVHDEEDLIPERVSRMYADYLPNSRLHLLKHGRTRGGHVPFSEQPEKFVEIVTSFLNEKR